MRCDVNFCYVIIGKLQSVGRWLGSGNLSAAIFATRQINRSLPILFYRLRPARMSAY